MSRAQDRKNAVVDINAAAKMYKSNLVGLNKSNYLTDTKESYEVLVHLT